MAADSEHRHRPGAFKQQNKAHKHGKHRSKGALEKETKGRTNVISLTKKTKKLTSKLNRRNQASQLRKLKRDEVLNQKRQRGGTNCPPLSVVVLPLCEGVDSQSVVKLLGRSDDEAVVTSSTTGATHISVPRFKQRFSFLQPNREKLYDVLDALKVADAILLIMSAEYGIDAFGEHSLSCLQAQGMPSAVHVVQGLKTIPDKKLTDCKKMLQKHLDKRFPREKFHGVDTVQDGLLVLRQLGNQKLKHIKYCENRSHLCAEEVTFRPAEGDSHVGTLCVSGYIRGQALSVNGLVHLPGWGDFQMSKIEAPPDPHPLVLRGKTKKMDAMDEDREEVKLLEKANPNEQVSLQSEVIPDDMDGEQTWPTEEELAEAEVERKVLKRVPIGTSDYQAAWIVDDHQEDDQNSEDDDTDSDEDDAMEDDAAESQDDSEEEQDEEQEDDEDEEFDTVSVSADGAKYDATIDIQEEQQMLAKYKDARQDQMFPDEVDTPIDTPARVRFQRFRGLKSFRTSVWDPKENLPTDYARIFQFENFTATKKRILKGDRDSGAMPGWYVRLHIEGVPAEYMASRSSDSPAVVYGLLPHEQKMSVMHFIVKRHHSYNEPIKSKERMIFHVGFRRFSACPIYSEHTNGSKHKFDRWLPNEGMAVATVFAPITFPSAPVLMFKANSDGSQDLVATGSVLSVNPDRIISKRLILSGHPFKINKKTATVRYMFFNREDILWFKPVELRTKHGRRGHIKMPLGTHGHMKCVFDGQMKSQDTVLMNLYKRMYPKWTYEARVSPPLSVGQGQEEMDTEVLNELFD